MSLPTPEQRRAADPRASVWVDANAGTGKTRVLADRVLRLLLDGAHPSSLLCLTFTKAAAGEMADRVMRRLAAWAAAPDAALAEELAELDGAAPSRGRLARAHGLFDTVLALPAGLTIMTVHGLCQHLLKRFPLEAGVPPSFEVLDPRTAAELLGLAREAVLAGAHSDPARAADLAQLVAGAADQTVLGALDAVIADKLEWQAARDAMGGLGRALARLAAFLDVDADADLDALIDAAMADAACDRTGLQAAARVLQEDDTRSRRECGLAVAGWLAADGAGRRRDLDHYRRSFGTFDKDGDPPGWRLSGTLFRGKSRERFAAPAAVLEAEIARLDALDAHLRARRLYDRTAALWRLAEAVLTAFDAAKRERAALDFDDLLLRTLVLLEGSVSRDWVRAKLDRAFVHVLVDEAQDTNPLQWRIVEALADEVFAGDGTLAAGERTLFVVGDAKQSIFRFQGADPAATAKVRERLEARAAAAGNPISGVALGTSFRSSQAVLDVVDRLLAAPATVAALGESTPHRAFRATAAGRVELWPLEDAAERPEAANPWAVPPETQRDDPAERRLAQRIARTVADWLARGEHLEAAGRPLRANDVLVLTRRRQPLQEVLVRAFKRAGVPVAGADRLALQDELAVQDLVHLAEAITMPENDFALACALKSPLFELDDDELLSLAHGRGAHERLVGRWRAMASTSPRLASAWARFEAWQRRADFVPPYEWFLGVLSGGVGAEGAFEGRRAFLHRFGGEVLDVLDAFVDQALAYEQGHAASLPGFLHWLGQSEDELQRTTAGGEGVRLMTAHGAKGLEAPVVFLADAGPRSDARRGTLLWLEAPALPLWRPTKAQAVAASARAAAAEAAAQLGDDLRLLYVAATRAAERLIVCGWQQRLAGKTTSWHDRFADALDDLGAATAADGTRIYATGVPAALEPAEPTPVAPAALPAALRRPAPPATRPRRLTPSETSGAAPRSGSPRSRALAVGRHVHRLLEHLPLAEGPAREAALGRYLDSRADDLDASDRDAVGAQVRRVLTDPALAPLFGPDAFAEQPVVGRLGEVEVQGQIDRLLITDERIWIADFKTGEAPAPGAAPPEPHLRQLAAYAALLRTIHPGRSIEAALIWTGSGAVSWVDEATLRSHLPEGLAIADDAAMA